MLDNDIQNSIPYTYSKSSFGSLDILYHRYALRVEDSIRHIRKSRIQVQFCGLPSRISIGGNEITHKRSYIGQRDLRQFHNCWASSPSRNMAGRICTDPTRDRTLETKTRNNSSPDEIHQEHFLSSSCFLESVLLKIIARFWGLL